MFALKTRPRKSLKRKAGKRSMDSAITIHRQTKSTKFTKPISSIQTILNLWKCRNQNNAFLAHVVIDRRKDGSSFGGAHIETNHTSYFLKFKSGLFMADYLIKNGIATPEDIILAVPSEQHELRQIVYNHIVEKIQNRHARHLRYLKKGT